MSGGRYFSTLSLLTGPIIYLLHSLVIICGVSVDMESSEDNLWESFYPFTR